MPSDKWRLSTLKSIGLIQAVVLAGVELAVVVFYGHLGMERLISELAISAVISTIVGVPVIAFVVYQRERLKTLADRLLHLSSTDQMTGLLNRQTFLERLDLHLFETGKKKSAGVFAYIDADHFKSINDRFGHAVGDRVIVLLAKHLRENARKEDLCARLGGEEFALFLKGADLAEAAVIADRLRREVELSGLKLGVPGLSISVSIGLAAHRAGMGALLTMQEADRSLYAAKHDGRNAVVIELQRYRA